MQTNIFGRYKHANIASLNLDVVTPRATVNILSSAELVAKVKPVTSVFWVS